MPSEIMTLSVTAAGLGFIHTLLGPDHYLPFVAIARAKKWSLPRTLSFTFLCGLGHVLSSVILGTLGILFGISLTWLTHFEGMRGDIAAWLLTSFGILYLCYGIRHLFHPKQYL